MPLYDLTDREHALICLALSRRIERLRATATALIQKEDRPETMTATLKLLVDDIADLEALHRKLNGYE